MVKHQSYSQPEQSSCATVTAKTTAHFVKSQEKNTQDTTRLSERGVKRKGIRVEKTRQSNDHRLPGSVPHLAAFCFNVRHETKKKTQNIFVEKLM